MTLLIFILTLSVMVLVHEFGHYFVAKKNDIRVEEFGLGLPPKIWGKKIGETEYTLNLLPFGGFVKLTGEEVESSDDEVLDDPRSFTSKTPFQRICVLLAGVTMNFVLAIALFYVFLMVNKYRSYEFPLFFNYKFKFGETVKIGTVITDVAEDSPAKEAGIEFGEIIVSIDGTDVNSADDIKAQLDGKLGSDVSVLLKDIKEREAESFRTITLQPMVNESGEEVLGVYLGEFAYVKYEKPFDKFFAGPLHLINMSFYSVKAFSEIVSFSFETRDIKPVSSSVAGPIGIYQLVDGILELDTKQAVLSLLDFIGIMSMSLAIINALPLPALDGGRVLFIVIEKIRGKRIKPELETEIHKYGMLFLLGLLFIVTIKDIFF